MRNFIQHEAEQAIVGAVVVDSSYVMPLVVEQIAADDFQTAEAKQVMQTCLDMWQDGKTIDLITITGKLKNKDVLMHYLVNCAELCVTPSNVDIYIKQVIKAKSLANVQIALLKGIAELNDSKNVDEVISSIIDSFNKIDRKGITVNSIKNLAIDFFGKFKDKGQRKGLRTGFSKIDKTLGSIMPGNFIVVAARPGMGKTAFGAKVARNIALNAKKILFMSIEMSEEELIDRFMSMESGVEHEKIRYGTANNAEIKTISGQITKITSMQLDICDKAAPTVAQIKSILMRGDYDCVVIDYLAYIKPSDLKVSREQQVSSISRDLKMMAKELKISVICLAQLNRANEARANKRPMLSDLRESGAIEQDADVVIFLHREGYYDSEKSNDVCEVIVAKNRHGAVGTIDVGWNGECVNFYELGGGY